VSGVVCLCVGGWQLGTVQVRGGEGRWVREWCVCLCGWVAAGHSAGEEGRRDEVDMLRSISGANAVGLLNDSARPLAWCASGHMRECACTAQSAHHEKLKNLLSCPVLHCCVAAVQGSPLHHRQYRQHAQQQVSRRDQRGRTLCGSRGSRRAGEG
jgi:hypothetical protein